MFQQDVESTPEQNYNIPNVTAHEAGHWTDYFYASAPNATRIVVAGSPHVGDQVTVTVKNPALTGTAVPGQETVSYTVGPDDTTDSIVSGLSTNIIYDSKLAPVTIQASYLGEVIYITGGATYGTYGTTYTTSVIGTGATEKLVATPGVVPSDETLMRLGGTAKAGDVITLIVHDTPFPGGQYSVSYTVVAGNTLSTIATKLAGVVNSNTVLKNESITATTQGTSGVLLHSASQSSIHVTFTTTISSGGTETVALSSSNYASESTLFENLLKQDWINLNALAPCGGSGFFTSLQDSTGAYFCSDASNGQHGYGTALQGAYAGMTNQAVLTKGSETLAAVFGISNHEIWAEEFATLVSKSDNYYQEGPNANHTNPKSVDTFINRQNSFSCTLGLIAALTSNGLPQWSGGNCPYQ